MYSCTSHIIMVFMSNNCRISNLKLWKCLVIHLWIEFKTFSTTMTYYTHCRSWFWHMVFCEWSMNVTLCATLVFFGISIPDIFYLGILSNGNDERKDAKYRDRVSLKGQRLTSKSHAFRLGRGLGVNFFHSNDLGF